MQSRDFAELQTLCERQHAVRFPPASGEDALDDLRAELGFIRLAPPAARN